MFDTIGLTRAPASQSAPNENGRNPFRSDFLSRPVTYIY